MEIAAIYDYSGRTMYNDYGSSTFRLKAKHWYVHTNYTSDPSAFHVKVCGSKQAAISWASSKRRAKEYDPNTKFYIYHA